MWKIGKSLFTLFIMGVPLWVVLVGIYQYQPTSLMVHLEEPDVRLFLGGAEYTSNSRELGPIDLRPGDYQMVVMRGTKTLFSYPISLEEGHSKEVWAHWKSGAGATTRETGVQGAFRQVRRDRREDRG